MGFHTFGVEERFAKLRSFFRIKQRTRENIKVDASFVFRKMRSHGTCFNKLDQRVPCGYGIVMSEMGDKRFTVALHVDYVVAEFRNETLNIAAGRNFFEITAVEVENKFLAIILFLVLFGHM